MAQTDAITDFIESLRDKETVNPLGIPDQGPIAETDLTDIFQAGVRTGARGLSTDIEYFKALGNTLLGDEEGAAQNIRRARVQEDLTAAELQGVESFKDFLDEPTAMGFLRQVSKGTGQISASAVTSLVGAGAGALVGTGVRYLGSKSARATAKQILQDSIERTAKGIATPDEQELADLAYNKMRQDIRDRIAGSAKVGGIIGAAAAEYPPLAGSNVSEVIDSGEELTTDRAMESALLAIPQTVVGVGAEATMFSVIKNIATSRAAKEGGYFWELAKNIGKGAVISAPAEGAAELVQEGMSVAYRSSMDDQFTREDAQLRLAEAAFAGFFGGGGLGAAGGGVGGIISNSGAIVDKSKDLLSKAQEFKARREIDKQQYGDVLGGQTAPEPQADINAQVNALIDDTSAKHSVWVAGTDPQFLAKTNEVTPVEVAGETMYSVFIPARGTLLSRNRNVAEEVLASGASDEALSKALGYSATKNEVADGDIVVRALDKDRNVVSEELTNEANLAKAEKAARRLMPEGGSIDTSLDVKGALEDRNRRLQAEQGPVVREMSAMQPGFINQDIQNQIKEAAIKAKARWQERDTRRKQEEDELKTKRREARRAKAPTDIAILDGDGNEISLPDDVGPFQTEEEAQLFLEMLKDNEDIKNDPERVAMVNSWQVGETDTSADIFKVIDDRVPENNTGQVGVSYTNRAELDETVDPNEGIDSRLETNYLFNVTETTETIIGKQDGYKAREAPDRVYPETGELRNEFKELFEETFDDGTRSDDIDFSRPFYGNMSDSFLRQAIELKKQNPDLGVNWSQNENGRYQLTSMITPDTQMVRYQERGGVEASLPLETFIKVNVDRAKRNSKYLNNRVQLIEPNAELNEEGNKVSAPINIGEFANAGKRLVEVDTGSFEGQSPRDSARAGLLAMLTELLKAGYDVQIDGVSIADDLPLRSDITVMTEGKGRDTVEVSLKDILTPDAGKEFFVMETVPVNYGTGTARRKVQDKGFPTKQQAEAYILSRTKAKEDTSGWSVSQADLNNLQRARRIGQLKLEGRFTVEWEVEAQGKEAFSQTQSETFPSEGLAERFAGDLEASGIDPEDIKISSQIFSDPTFAQEEKVEQVGTEGAPDPETGRTGKIWSGSGEGAWPSDQLSAQMGDAPRMRARSTVDKPVFKPDYPLDILANLLSPKIINSIMRVLKLRKPTSIIGLKEFEALSPEEQVAFFNEFGDPKAAEFTRQEIEKLLANPDNFGKYLGFSDAHIILVDNRSDNQVQNTLVTAHELGHAFLEESKGLALDNKALRKRLEKAFQKAKGKTDAPDAYNGPEGFDEWFADQLGVWALRFFKESEKSKATKTVPELAYSTSRREFITKPKNVVDKFFKDLVQKLNDMYRAMVPALRKRFRDYNPDFDSFMNEVVARSRGSPDLWTFGEETINLRDIDPRLVQGPDPKKSRRLRAVTAQSRGSSGVNTPMLQFTSGLRAAKLGWEQKAIVREMSEIQGTSAEVKRAEEAISSFSKGLNNFLNNPKIRSAVQWVRTMDGVMRSINSVIADMFYVPAQAEGKGGKIGLVRAKSNAKDYFLGQLGKILGEDPASWDSKENKDALKLAAEGGFDLKHPDPNVVAKAIELRKFLEDMYDNYIAKTPGADIEKRKFYFPVALNIQELVNDPELAARFKNLLMEEDPTMTEEMVDKALDYFIRRDQYIQTEQAIEVDATDPLTSVEKARNLTNSIEPSKLADFTLSPAEALVKYIRHVTTRMEFLRATRDPETGVDLLQEELQKLSSEDRAVAVDIIKRHMGYRDREFTSLEKKWLTASNYLVAFNWVTLLPLATIASITEFGGAILNSKEFNMGVLDTTWKTFIKTINSREEAKAFAIDLGVVLPNTLNNVIMTEADHEFLNPKLRAFSEKFFRGIGLEQFTNFTREFAAQMAVRFLYTHGFNKTNNPRSPRYLMDLGVSAADVQAAWDNKTEQFDFNSEAGQRIRSAIIKFTESSMLRPNSAERPFWANDPRFQIIWQLKSFLYSFSKVIGGGIIREMQARKKEGSTSWETLGGMGMTIALAGIAFMPLAMLSLELRELAKAGIAGVLPGVEAGSRYFRSDRMDWGPYMVEIFDRSGFNGPLAIANSMLHADRWDKSPLAPALGPTYEILETAWDKGWETFPDRLIPLYSTVY